MQQIKLCRANTLIRTSRKSQDKIEQSCKLCYARIKAHISITYDIFRIRFNELLNYLKHGISPTFNNFVYIYIIQQQSNIKFELRYDMIEDLATE